jgi:lysophospholipase L1-like esterase
MKAGLTRIFVGILALTPLSLLGCSSDSSPAHSGSGGSTGAAGTTSGGVSAGGATTSPAGSGGAITSSGTPASGGQSQASSVPQGGSATGGAVTSASGQPASGGSAGSATGGRASGGAAGGGNATGGNAAGGSVAGATVTGGSVAGGSVAGGSVAGSSVAGSSRAGGSVAGGSVAGGSGAGGSRAGGSVAGGSVAGGSVAGGSATGGRVTGGTTTGGVSAGGAGSGGRTTAGGSSGTAAGGAVVTPATGTYPVSSGKPTIYLASDSTVSYYATNPNNQEGLGQELQNFFTSDVVVVDDAIGGRSSKSFIDEGHLDAILAVIKPGDYLFAEWGINDRYTSDTTRYTNPATTYRTYLQQYIDGARSKNAIPVIITPTPRLDYQNGVFNNDYVAYCQADAAVAASTNTPLIDLQTMALAYYTQIGITAVQTTIVLVENGQPNVLHFQAHGAYEMARLVALGVQALNLPISQFVIQAKLDGG